MTSVAVPVPAASRTTARPTAWAAFWALLARDLRVLRKTLAVFIVRTAMQPVLLMFVFTFVFPKIGQGIGGRGGSGAFSTLLVSGVVGLSIIFQGIQAVALPLVQEFGYTKEIEDRVLAPLSVDGVAIAKIMSGALQGVIAAAVVFPLAYLIPTTPVHLHFNWLVLLTVTPLACILGGALGLAVGTGFDPRQVPLIFSIIVLPMTFLGAIYYPWSVLGSIRWLQVVVLVNPLIYISEGMRAALTPTAHMSLWAVYPAMVGFTLLLGFIGLRGFRKRVLT
jgi:ABC-2 type transport system permease protein